jgi:hypothetical protein
MSNERHGAGSSREANNYSVVKIFPYLYEILNPLLVLFLGHMLCSPIFHRPLFKTHFNNILPSKLRYSDWSCGCANQNFMWITYFSRLCPCPVHLIAFPFIILTTVNEVYKLRISNLCNIFRSSAAYFLLNFSVLTVVLLFWGVTPCRLINIYRLSKDHNVFMFGV